MEGPNNAESTDPLMCCISCPDTRGYEEAKVRVRFRQCALFTHVNIAIHDIGVRMLIVSILEFIC